MDEVSRVDLPTEDIQALIRELRRVEARLRALTGGEIDAVLDVERGVPILLQDAQEELRRTKAGLELMLEHLPAVVWTTDAALEVTSLSGARVGEARGERDQIVGRRLSELLRATAIPGLMEAHQRALQGQATHFDAQIGERVFDCWVNPKADSSGQFVGAVGLAVDVTERVRREAALKELSQGLENQVEARTAELSQAYEELQVTEEEIRQQNEELRVTRQALEAERRRYQELFEFAPDGYIVTDEQGVIEQANQAACDLLGVRDEYLRGKPLSIYVSSPDRGVVHGLMDRAEREGQEGSRVEAEVQLSPRNSDPVPVSVSVAAVEEGDGRPKGLRWMVGDISESRRLLRENKRQRVFLQRLMEVAPVGIAVVRGDDHRFEMANTAYRSIPGARGPVVGRRFGEVFPAVPDDAGTAILDQVYRTGQAVRLRERRGAFISREGQSYWTVDVAPLQGDDGVVDGVLMIAHDVSQEVRVRKQMERLAARMENQADALRAVFEAMTDAVMVYNLRGVVVRANRAAIEVCGRDPVGSGSSWIADRLDLREPDGGRISLDHLPWSRALRGERVRGARCELKDARDRRLTMVVSAAPLGTDGDLGGAVTIWHDVTERERLLAEIDQERRRTAQFAEDLARERDTLQTIMETTDAQLAYLDADFRFVKVNTAYAEGAGQRAEELIGRGHFDLFPDRENEAIFEQVRESGEAVFFDAKPFVYSDQPERGVTYWDWSLIPVKDDDGAVRGLVLSLLEVTERETLMEQLASERAKLQAIIENAPEGIVVADAKGRIVLANPAAEELYSRPVPYGEEYASHSSLRVCRSDGTAIPPRELPLTRSALDGETLHDVDLAMVLPDGERLHLLADTVPIRDRAGEISGAIGIFRDITERVRAEARVRQYADQLRVLHEIDLAILAAGSAEEIAEATLRGLEELVPSAVSRIILVDSDKAESHVLASFGGEGARSGEAEWCSLSWHRAVGVLAQGMSFVVEDRGEVPEADLKEILRAQGLRSMTCAPLVVGGTLFGCLRVGRKEAGGLSDTELAMLQAVADQAAIGIHQAELHEQLECHTEELEVQVAVRTAQLRASEARLRAIFEQSVLGIALLDNRGRVMAGNPALCDMLGRTREEIAGELFARFAHPDEEITAALRDFRDVARGEQDYQRLETRYVAADGDERWVNLVISPVLTASSEARFLIAMAEDITERKLTQAALVQSERLATTGRLAAALAHEINNPLQAVLGCLGLAKESVGDGDDEDLDQYLEMGLQELRRAAGIVSRLRDASRPVDTGRAEPTNLNGLIDDMLTLTERRLEEAQIEVVRRTAEGLPKPEVVPDRIKQVLLNLVLNGIDAMSRGGTLELATWYDDKRSEVCLGVKDSGPGIPAEVLPNLFSPFFSTKDDGLGLGLFVSQNIVQEYGGRMDVESEIGQGTTFTVRLPV